MSKKCDSNLKDSSVMICSMWFPHNAGSFFLNGCKTLACFQKQFRKISHYLIYVSDDISFIT